MIQIKTKNKNQVSGLSSFIKIDPIPYCNSV